MASRRPLAAVAVAAAAALLASGCANIPTVGRPTQVKGISTEQGQPSVQPIPPVPAASMNELDIVQGFIAASASFAHKHAAARAFLEPKLQRTWQPGWAAAIVTGLIPKVSKEPNGPVNMNGESALLATVTVTAHQVATISDVGRYLNSPASTTYTFQLARVGNQWRITGLPSPSSLLLLTQADFQEVYQPRNLYVWTPSDQTSNQTSIQTATPTTTQALVPEPVFAPQEGTSATASSVAQNLIKALLANQAHTSWLGSDTESRFPRGTRLLGRVDVDGQTATVNLGGAAARASPPQFEQMAAQLVVTLTSKSYTQPPVARWITLEVNGRLRPIGGRPFVGLSHYAHLVPGFASGLPLYFIDSNGLVSELRPGTRAQPIQKPLATGQSPFSLIAVSGGSQPQFAGTLTTSRGCVIYYGGLTRLGSLAHQTIPIAHSGPCTSVDWDSHGNIWAVAGHAVWVLPPGSRQPTEVPLPQLPSGKLPREVLALSVAPDGVRAALLIRNKNSPPQVALTAIGGSGVNITFSSAITIGSGLADPVALSWYDADHVMALSRSQLYEVPINGSTPIPAGPAPNARSVTAAGPGQVATAGSGVILTSTGPNQSQQPAAKGTSPTYPG
ncbi:MAG: LpqB family beta-propeller domain-containing protein [Streptosporangiaceae bacterium]